MAADWIDAACRLNALQRIHELLEAALKKRDSDPIGAWVDVDHARIVAEVQADKAEGLIGLIRDIQANPQSYEAAWEAYRDSQKARVM